jgi:hypothetical protein
MGVLPLGAIVANLMVYGWNCAIDVLTRHNITAKADFFT